MSTTPTGRFSAHFPYGQARTVPSGRLAIRRALAADHLEVAALDDFAAAMARDGGTAHR